MPSITRAHSRADQKLTRLVRTLAALVVTFVAAMAAALLAARYGGACAHV